MDELEVLMYVNLKLVMKKHNKIGRSSLAANLFLYFLLTSTFASGQLATNIRTTSDGSNVVVWFDLKEIPKRKLVHVDLRLRIADSIYHPKLVLGDFVYRSDISNTSLIWEASNELPGLNAEITPMIKLSVRREKYFEMLSNEGRLNQKSFSPYLSTNLITPGLGLVYLNEKKRGTVKAALFWSLVGSSILTRLKSHAEYQTFLNSSDINQSQSSFELANRYHQISLTLGVTAASFYVLDQISALSKRGYFRVGANQTLYW